MDTDHKVTGEKHNLVALGCPDHAVELEDANGVGRRAIIKEDRGAVATRGRAVVETLAGLRRISCGVGLPTANLKVTKRDVDGNGDARGVAGDIDGSAGLWK